MRYRIANPVSRAGANGRRQGAGAQLDAGEGGRGATSDHQSHQHVTCMTHSSLPILPQVVCVCVRVQIAMSRPEDYEDPTSHLRCCRLVRAHLLHAEVPCFLFKIDFNALLHRRKRTTHVTRSPSMNQHTLVPLAANKQGGG